MRDRIGTVALGMVVLAGGVATAAEHPSLVRIEQGLCLNCHGDIVEDRAAVHEPVDDDCTICHEFSKGDDGTRVALVESEPDLCLMCHDEHSEAAAGTQAYPHPPLADSCANCHDPHASDHPSLLVADPVVVCSECHDPVDLAPAHGEQLTSATRCGSCHDPHGSDHDHMLSGSTLHVPFAEGSCAGCHRKPFGTRTRLRTRGSKLCTACHGEFSVPGGEGSIHGALGDVGGRAGCLACHDPHMSAAGSLLTGSGPALCADCHADITAAATADGGHAVAADDCLTCHGPHVAPRADLLLESSVDTCAMCHDLSDGDLASAHLGADPGTLECATCHDPHGTGNVALLATHVHAPVGDGCDNCHDGSAEALHEGGGKALCVMCHDDVASAAAAVPVPHAALEVGGCIDCHNPHASDQPNLKRLPSGGECAACHEDQVAGADEIAHGIIEVVGCEACHEPHGSNQATLLRAAGDDLCLSCHDPARVDNPEGAPTVSYFGRIEVPVEIAGRAASLRLTPEGDHGHPIEGHRTLGELTKKELKRTRTTFDGTRMSCASCHDPHKGASRGLFVGGAGSSMQLCTQCHPK